MQGPLYPLYRSQPVIESSFALDGVPAAPGRKCAESCHSVSDDKKSWKPELGLRPLAVQPLCWWKTPAIVPTVEFRSNPKHARAAVAQPHTSTGKLRERNGPIRAWQSNELLTVGPLASGEKVQSRPFEDMVSLARPSQYGAHTHPSHPPRKNNPKASKISEKKTDDNAYNRPAAHGE